MSKRDRLAWVALAGIVLGMLVTARYYRIPVELRVPKWEALVQILPYLVLLPLVAALLSNRE